MQGLAKTSERPAYRLQYVRQAINLPAAEISHAEPLVEVRPLDDNGNCVEVGGLNPFSIPEKIAKQPGLYFNAGLQENRPE